MRGDERHDQSSKVIILRLAGFAQAILEILPEGDELKLEETRSDTLLRPQNFCGRGRLNDASGGFQRATHAFSEPHGS